MLSKFFIIGGTVMLKKKHIINLVVTIVLLIPLVALYLFVTQNTRLLNNMVNEMKSLIADYEKIELVETKSVYGKLNGNGNGIDFFGAALIRSDSEEAINELVSNLQEKYETVEYSPQNGNAVVSKYLEHRKLSFNHSFDSSDKSKYYTVYFFTHHKNANYMDPWGH